MAPRSHGRVPRAAERRQSRGDQWNGRNHQDMLRLGAQLVAEKCKALDIPVRHVHGDDLERGEKGICST